MIQLNPNRKIENVNPDASEKTATNSFTTLDGGLVSALNVAFTPIQDLHGYSKPWAGGAGKNKIPLPTAETKNGVTLSHNTDGSITITGTASATTYFDCFAGNFNSTSFVGWTFRANSTFTDWRAVTISFRISDNSRTSLQDMLGNTDVTIADNGDSRYLALRIGNGFAVPDGGITIYPMLEWGDNTFEPYSNISPISGHTEVKSKINNTTYTTALGNTYYGGDVEQVSGEGEYIFKTITFDGSDDEVWNIVGSSNRAYIAISDIDISTPDNAVADVLSNIYPTAEYLQPIPLTSRITGRYNIAQINIFDYNVIGASTTIANWKTYLSNNPLQVVYKLATPTALTLTGQSITAEVGENNVSAPLENQEIVEDGVTYKEMFSWADVVAYVQSQVNP